MSAIRRFHCILKWQHCKIFTKLVPLQIPSRSSHRRCSVYLNIAISAIIRNSHPEVFKRKRVKICSKFKVEHPCGSVISIKLLCNNIEIALRDRCSPANLQDGCLCIIQRDYSEARQEVKNWNMMKNWTSKWE